MCLLSNESPLLRSPPKHWPNRLTNNDIRGSDTATATEWAVKLICKIAAVTSTGMGHGMAVFLKKNRDARISKRNLAKESNTAFSKTVDDCVRIGHGKAAAGGQSSVPRPWFEVLVARYQRRCAR